MDQFEALMVRILANGLKICNTQCVPKSEKDYLTNF